MGTERRERQKANRQLKQAEVHKQVRRSSLARRGILIAIAAGVIFVALVLIAVLGGGDDDDPAVTTTTVAAVASTAATETTESSDTEPPDSVPSDTAELSDTTAG